MMGGGTPNDMGVLDNDWRWRAGGGSPVAGVPGRQEAADERLEAWEATQWESTKGLGTHWESVFSRVEQEHGNASALVFSSWSGLFDCLSDGAAKRVYRACTKAGSAAGCRSCLIFPRQRLWRARRRHTAQASLRTRRPSLFRTFWTSRSSSSRRRTDS